MLSKLLMRAALLFFVFFTIVGLDTQAQPCLYVELSPNINTVNDALESANGTIWLATDEGVYERNPINGNYSFHALEMITASNGSQSPVEVKRIKELNGTLYMLTAVGAFYQSNGTWQKFSSTSGLPADVVNDMAVDQNGNLWFATTDGIAVYDGNNYLMHRPFSNNNVVGLGVRNNNIYASNMSTTEADIYYNGISWLSLPSNSSFGGNRTARFFFDGLGNLYTQSYFLGNRVHKFSNNQWTAILNATTDGASLSRNKLYFLVGNRILSYNGSQLDTLQSLCASPNGLASLFVKANGVDRFYSLGMLNNKNALINIGIRSDYTSATLGNSKLTAAVSSNGALFKDNLRTGLSSAEGFAQLNRTDHPTKPMVFAANLWATATTNGTAVASAATYNFDNISFFSGPVSNRYDVAYINTYDRVWHITKTQIVQHISKAGSAGYNMPEAIENWPGNGNTNKGEALLLAPFYDSNGNGIYEPQQGEYPLIKGDEAVFFMTNDHRALRSVTQGNSTMLEAHGMLYLYDTTDADIAGTLFIEYQLYNRSAGDLNDVIPGLWADFDLGNASDDGLATDSTRKLVYAYNLDLSDDGPNGFGTNIPAAGFVFLSSKLSGSLFYANASPGNPPASMQEPSKTQDFVNFMHQRWKDGSPLLLELPGGDGYGNAGQHATTRHHYETNSGWQYGHAAYDSRSIATGETQPILAPNQSMCFSLAFISALEPGGGLFGSANKLLNRAAVIDSFYSDQQLACTEHIVSLANPNLREQITLYPIPTDGLVKLKLPIGISLQALSVFNLSGQKLLSITQNAQIDLRNFPSGIYLIKGILNNGELFTKKLVKH